MATRRRRAPSATKTDKPAKALVMPSPEAIEEARATRKASADSVSVPPSTVYGLPEGYKAAVMCSTLSDGTKARTRARWTAKGWVELDGLHSVSGYDLGAHVFVKPSADYDEARKERAHKIEEAKRKRLMHR